MKISLFIDNFGPAERQKDPGVIAASLARLGHDITVVYRCGSGPSLHNVKEKMLRGRLRGRSFWKQDESEIVIIYSWLSLRYSRLIELLVKSGRKVVLKLDSDGHLIYPLKPSYLRSAAPASTKSAKIIYWLRLIEWSVAAKLVSRMRIQQLEKVQAAIIESPAARDNLLSSLNYWGRHDLSPRISFIPNPVDIPRTSGIKKQRAIVSIGRWDDERKNARGLVDCLAATANREWLIRLVGSGSEKLKHELLYRSPDLRVEAYEFLNRPRLAEMLAGSMIFFAPSISESFNLAAAEAVCSGLTLAAKPLESFRYLAGEGLNGTLNEDLGLALSSEITKWEQGKASPDTGHWQEELSPENIAQKIERLINGL